eukprot:753414-Hanusia_phi.AAC.7
MEGGRLGRGSGISHAVIKAVLPSESLAFTLAPPDMRALTTCRVRVRGEARRRGEGKGAEGKKCRRKGQRNGVQGGRGIAGRGGELERRT